MVRKIKKSNESWKRYGTLTEKIPFVYQNETHWRYKKKSVRSQLKKGLKKYKRHNLVGRWMLKVLFVDLES